MDVKWKLRCHIITCVVVSLLCHKLWKWRGFSLLLPWRKSRELARCCRQRIGHGDGVWSTYHFLMQWLSSTKIPHKNSAYIIHICTGLLLRRSWWLVVSLLVKQAAWIPRVDRELSWSFIKAESDDITIAILDGEPAWIWRRKSQQKGAAWKITDFPNPVGKFTNTSCPLARCTRCPLSLPRSRVLSLCTSDYLPT